MKMNSRGHAILVMLTFVLACLLTIRPFISRKDSLFFGIVESNGKPRNAVGWSAELVSAPPDARDPYYRVTFPTGHSAKPVVLITPQFSPPEPTEQDPENRASVWILEEEFRVRQKDAMGGFSFLVLWDR